MESVTVYAPAPHGLEFTTLFALAVSVAVVGVVVWHVIARIRATRQH